MEDQIAITNRAIADAAAYLEQLRIKSEKWIFPAHIENREYFQSLLKTEMVRRWLTDVLIKERTCGCEKDPGCNSCYSHGKHDSLCENCNNRD